MLLSITVASLPREARLEKSHVTTIWGTKESHAGIIME